MIAVAGDLSIAGAHLHLASVTVLSTAVPHSISLRPDEAVITE